MKLQLPWLLGNSLFIIPLQPVQAVMPLAAQEFISHCKAFPDQADSNDGQFCIRYIQGFIDGTAALWIAVLLSSYAIIYYI